MNFTTLFHCVDWLGKSPEANQLYFLFMVCADTDHKFSDTDHEVFLKLFRFCD